MAEATTDTVTKAKKTIASGTKAESAKPVSAKPAKAAAPKATAKAAPKKAAAAKPAAGRRTSKTKNLKNVTPEQRYRMICDAAYFKAEKRNFAPENEIQDWLDAEAEINRLLGM